MSTAPQAADVTPSTPGSNGKKPHTATPGDVDFGELEKELEAAAHLNPEARRATFLALRHTLKQQLQAHFAGAALPLLPKDVLGSGISAADLLQKQLPKAKWAVEGLVPEGLTILAGKPKMGKSWLVLSISMAVAQGGRVLNYVDVPPGDVLYLGLEDNDRRLQGRLHMLLGLDLEHGSVRGGLERLTFHTEWPRTDVGGLDLIRQWLSEKPNARLVVIDTLQKIRPRNKNKKGGYGEDYDETGDLQRLAVEGGVAVVVVHHLRKGDSDDPFEMISGTFGISGAMDTGMVLSRERGKFDAGLFISGRDVEETELALTLDRETMSWRVIGDAAQEGMSDERRAIIKAMLRLNAPCYPKDLYGLFPDRSQGGVRKLIKKMFEADDITYIPGEGYKPNSAKAWDFN